MLNAGTRVSQQQALQRNGSMLEPDRFDKIIGEWVDDSAYAGDLYHGFRADIGIVPMNVEADSKQI